MSRVLKPLASDLGEAVSAGIADPRSDDLLHLVRAASAGDGDAAATLVMHVGGPMLSVVRKVLGHHHPDIDDVTQDAVMAFLGTLPNFRGECSVAHFAQRIALFTALAAMRRLQLRTRWAEPGGGSVENIPDRDVDSPLASTLARRRRELVRRLLEELPDVIGESLALHFVLGYTVEEIGAALAVSPNTVWSRLRLGKRALRRKLDGDAELADLLGVTA
jgi:RNA polymerase sigma-70 factor (ECF subfamily)